MEFNGQWKGRGEGGERENTLVGGRDMWVETEKRGRTTLAKLLPKGDSPVMQEERGRLEEEGERKEASRWGRREGGGQNEEEVRVSVEIREDVIQGGEESTEGEIY